MLLEFKVIHLWCAVAASLFFSTVSPSCLVLFRDVNFHRFFSTFPSSYTFSVLPSIFPFDDPVAKIERRQKFEELTMYYNYDELCVGPLRSIIYIHCCTTINEYPLEKVLNEAAMKDRTVILTTLTEAWAAPDSVIDLFLESFRIGVRTRTLSNHLVIIALDQKAFARCQVIHSHCFCLVSEEPYINEEAYFMTPRYLMMMWRRIDFLRSVLELGYNFVFTDADIMWYRNPFPQFHLDVDFQIACDHFTGSFDDVQNRPNGGFNFVKSNNRSIESYKIWYSSRETYHGYHDQDILNFIKVHPFITAIGLKMKFLDSTNFGGLCEPSMDLNQVCTMHSNCCFGMDSKLHGLMLHDWKHYLSLPPSLKKLSVVSCRVPQKCRLFVYTQVFLCVAD